MKRNIENRNRERRKTLYRKPIFVEWESQNYYNSCNDLIIDKQRRWKWKCAESVN